MTKEFILNHLANRYLTGYTVIDKKYISILNYLQDTVIKPLIKEKTKEILLESELTAYVGPYNVITASLYLELARRFYAAKYHKQPSTSNLYSLL